MLRRRAVVDLDLFASQCSGTLDARADAFGHGLALVAPVARAAHVRMIVVSNDRDAGIALSAGFGDEAVVIDTTGGGADQRAYGLDVGGIPVLSLVGEVVALKRVEGGAGVSYGYSYRTAAPTTLALVGLGYADGVPRAASNRARVAVGGAAYPLVGRIAMDQLVLDVGDASLGLGGDAVLFGDPARGEPSVLDWAVWTEREPLAVTAGIASRVERVAR